MVSRAAGGRKEEHRETSFGPSPSPARSRAPPFPRSPRFRTGRSCSAGSPAEISRGASPGAGGDTMTPARERAASVMSEVRLPASSSDTLALRAVRWPSTPLAATARGGASRPDLPRDPLSRFAGVPAAPAASSSPDVPSERPARNSVGLHSSRRRESLERRVVVDVAAGGQRNATAGRVNGRATRFPKNSSLPARSRNAPRN